LEEIFCTTSIPGQNIPQKNKLVLHAAPPIEPCPHDSIQVADICKCNPELCSKPPCMYELNVSVNGTDIPGSCCTIYSCVGCPNDTLINGKCPCAPDAILNSKGACECVDLHKSLVQNECVCNADRCELPDICAKNYVSVSEHDECCTKTKCIKCPEDSFVTNNGDDEVENKCVCYPCKDKDCEPNEKVVIIERGNSFPGSCCDIYKCEAMEKTCVAESIVYGEGDTWETIDSQTCKCQAGISFCSKPNEEESFRPCHKEGRVYKHNDSWMLDSCTNCTCFNGEIKCIAHMCEISEGRLKKPECQPLNCTKVCPNGYKQNKRGCKQCKCNYTHKFDDILQKYNITKNKLVDILDDYFAHNKNELNSTTNVMFPTTPLLTTNTSDDQFSTPLSETHDCSRNITIQWILVGGLLFSVITLALITWWVCHRKKGSYNTNPAGSTIYERMNLTKDALFNNNYIGNDNKNKKNIKGGV
jgi:hypothetical protein